MSQYYIERKAITDTSSSLFLNTCKESSTMFKAIATELFWLYHNCIAHPISGVLGCFQLKRASTWAHDFGLPEEQSAAGTTPNVEAGEGPALSIYAMPDPAEPGTPTAMPAPDDPESWEAACFPSS
jgi:hypothetical protein